MFNLHAVGDLIEEMKRIGVSADGIEIMQKKGEFYTLKLENIPLKGALLLKQEALAVGMECALPWCTAALNCDTTDAILFGTLRQFEILVEKMKLQPFKSVVMADEIQECISNLRNEPEFFMARGEKISVSPFSIMGILNVTPDSFSDGGMYNDVESAVKRAREMVKQGANIIDVGGESSRPFSEPVSAEEEMRRVLPVIESISDLKVPISVDTYKPEVVEEALKRGASIVNDISGLRSDEMVRVVKDYDAGVVIMHMKGEPRNMQLNPHYDDVVSEVLKFLRERVEYAVQKGVRAKNIVIDPGIGFGKRVEDNLMLLKSIRAFTSLGIPVLVGVSRKSYIGKVLDTDVNERLEGTIASNVIAYINGAKIFRVHDVEENLRALKMASEIRGAFI